MASSEAAIWERIIHPEGELTAEAARAILKLTFPAEDRRRMHDLARKAQAGALTVDEELQMEDYERVGSMLSVLKSKARRVLKQASRSSAS